MRRGTEEKKAKLLKCGMDLMHRNGYSATSVDDIVRSAGIPKGSFYNYYKSKEEFAVDALHVYTDAVVQMKAEIGSNGSISAKERLRKIFNASCKELKKSKYALGCFCGNMAQEVSDTNPEMRKIIEESFVKMRNNMTALIEEGIIDKSIPSGANPERLADFILNTWEGALLRMKSAKSPEPLDLFLEYLDSILEKK